MSLVFLWDGVTLLVKCSLFPLISIEGLFWLLVSVPSAGLPGPVLLLATCFLGWTSSFASVLLFSSLCGFLLLCQFPFLGIFKCLDLLVFSPPFLLSLSLVLVARCILGPSLPLEFHFAVWVVLRSLSGLLCSFALAPFSFWIGRSFLLSLVFCY